MTGRSVAGGEVAPRPATCRDDARPPMAKLVRHLHGDGQTEPLPQHEGHDASKATAIIDRAGEGPPRSLAGNPDSPQAVVFLASIGAVIVGL